MFVDIDPALEATVDPGVFDRILSNLVTNALRYGGPPITVFAGQVDGRLKVAVEDRGEGVPTEFVPALFERFSRSDSARPKGPGTGLGLAIARSYAEAHQGELAYREAEPHGARFEVVLPAEGSNSLLKRHEYFIGSPSRSYRYLRVPVLPQLDVRMRLGRRPGVTRAITWPALDLLADAKALNGVAVAKHHTFLPRADSILTVPPKICPVVVGRTLASTTDYRRREREPGSDWGANQSLPAWCLIPYGRRAFGIDQENSEGSQPRRQRPDESLLPSVWLPLPRLRIAGAKMCGGNRSSRTPREPDEP